MIKNTKLVKSDYEIYDIIEKEKQRQFDHLELIASENYVSPAVMQAVGSVLTNKYAEGYPNKRYYGGCEVVDLAEQLAIDRLKEIFGCEHANVQPHSGANANFAVYVALLNPGDTILGMDLSNGGHLTHGAKVNVSGKVYNSVCYGVDENGFLDYKQVARLAKEHKPKLIVAGASAYSRKIDFKKFRKIADEVGAYLMVDMAHIAGLVAAGIHPSPVPYAHVVTSTTHKTLRGPRGGLILCTADLAQKIDKAVFPGTQGGPLMHVIAAKAVAFGEALTDEFKAYQTQLHKNAAAFCKALIAEDIDIVSKGTDNHLMLLDLRKYDISGKELEHRLDEVHITANKNTIPNDPKSPFVTSGLRVGTAAVTSRGFKEEEMKLIAKWIKLAITDFENSKEEITKSVLALCEKYPIYND